MEVVTVLVLLVFNIVLPTLDTFTDINLVYKLYRRAHECYEKLNDYPNREEFSGCDKMATALLTPFLLNYFVCFITFLRKEKNKKFTFIFALLNIYPQLGIRND